MVPTRGAPEPQRFVGACQPHRPGAAGGAARGRLVGVSRRAGGRGRCDRRCRHGHGGDRSALFRNLFCLRTARPRLCTAALETGRVSQELDAEHVANARQYRTPILLIRGSAVRVCRGLPILPRATRYRYAPSSPAQPLCQRLRERAPAAVVSGGPSQPSGNVQARRKPRRRHGAGVQIGPKVGQNIDFGTGR